MVFSDGHRVRGSGADGATLVQTLDRGKRERTRLASSGEFVAPGWIDIQTEDGLILVNCDQVAYVGDVD